MPARDGESAPTLGSVANRAGVSKSLVSLVMRSSPHVSEVRRQAVLEAARDLGYRPNAMARSLVERRTRTVGVIIADVANPWFVDLLDGLQSVLREAGMRVLLGDGRLESETSEPLREAFLELRVEGLCLVGSLPLSGLMREAGISVPTVVAGARVRRPSRVDVIANDDFVGANLAVDHLVGLGHTRIVHIGGRGGSAAEFRQAGYEAAMIRHGLARQMRVVPSDFTEHGGYTAAKALLSDRSRPTAVFALNDMACIGALSAADELHLAVPQELSLVGYDNTHLAGIRHLSLTTVNPAHGEVGRIAGGLLLRRIEMPRRRSREELIEPELVVRNSTAAALTMERPRRRATATPPVVELPFPCSAKL